MLKVILIILAVLFAISVIRTYKWFFLAAAILAAAGYVGYRVYKAKKAKSPDITAAEPVAKGESAVTESTPTAMVEPVITAFTPTVEEEPVIAESAPNVKVEPVITESEPTAKVVPVITESVPTKKVEPVETASDAAIIAEPEPTDKITPYELKGVFACEKDIFRGLMELNPAYDWKKRELIDAYMTDYPVYKWVPKQLPAMLIPEPDNQHDPNAIKVVVGETTIGYIPKEKTGEVRKILDEGRLLNLAYEITGGKYKLVTEEYDPDKDKSTYDLESGYEEVSAKAYVKEKL